MKRGPFGDLFRRPGPTAGISVCGLLAYDWRQALDSLASYYAIADEIVLGLDRRRVSWSGKPYRMDVKACLAALRRRDPDRKVRVIQGDFHSLPAPMANETAERNVLAAACRPGHWVLQVDADEILLQPARFADWLRRYPWKRQVLARWISVFKVIGDTALVIDSDADWVPLASRHPRYHVARHTREWGVRAPLELLHFSWGRSDRQLQAKLTHWGHSRDFDTRALLRLWRGVTLANFDGLRDFHPLEGRLWPRLRAVPLRGLPGMKGPRA